MSKGSTPRPFSVDQNTFNSNWDLIFKKPEYKQDDGPLTQEQLTQIIVGAEINSDSAEYSIGTQEKYNEFVKTRGTDY